MNKFRTILILCFSVATLHSFAQEYHFAIGGRWAKVNSGVSLKYMGGAENNNGIQVELDRTYIYSKGWTLKAFYVRQASFRIPLLQIPLDYILGGGFHAGYFANDQPISKSTRVYPYHKRKSYFNSEDGGAYGPDIYSVGVDLTAQLEYLIPWDRLPLTVSVDFNPWYEFVNPGSEILDFGFTVRYAFIGR